MRFLSAVKIGCGYCTIARGQDEGGTRLLPDAFYAQASADEPDWSRVVEPDWRPVFQMGIEVLEGGEISAATMEALRASLSDTQIVESLFFMLLLGASHRFSRALGIQAACSMPGLPVAGEGSAPA